jgi:hypothetical protein
VRVFPIKILLSRVSAPPSGTLTRRRLRFEIRPVLGAYWGVSTKLKPKSFNNYRNGTKKVQDQTLENSRHIYETYPSALPRASMVTGSPMWLPASENSPDHLGPSRVHAMNFHLCPTGDEGIVHVIPVGRVGRIG